jgi:hypothetical protein
MTLIRPQDFFDWLFMAPGHRSAWLIFFSFGLGFFIAMTLASQELAPLLPAGLCAITILTFGLRASAKPEEINCGAIYIMRRSDGILKFGKAKNLAIRLGEHRRDYQAHFDVVSSWIVPDMDRFESMALFLTRDYFYQEAHRRELRQMTEAQLTQFILEFTNKVHGGWIQ